MEPVWGGNYAENMQKTVAALQAGSPPDVAVHLAVDLITLRDLDAVVPLDEFVQKEGGEKFLADFFPGFVNDLKADGKIWAIPFQRSTPILYYNKDLFKKAGPGSEQAAHELGGVAGDRPEGHHAESAGPGRRPGA